MRVFTVIIVIIGFNRTVCARSKRGKGKTATDLREKNVVTAAAAATTATDTATAVTTRRLFCSGIKKRQ